MQVIRPAGLNERRCITRDVLGLYGWIVTAATYSQSLCHILDLGSLYKVLKQCIAEHPILGIAIQDAKTENPRLASVSIVDLRAHLRVSDSAMASGTATETIQELLEKVHNEPFRDYDTRPQWHVFILPLERTSQVSKTTFQVAFASSHALTDGMSGLTFHSTFLRALRNISNLDLDENPICVISSHRTLPLPLESAADLSISWSFLIRGALAEFMPSPLAKAVGLKDIHSGDCWYGSNVRSGRSASKQLLRTEARVVFVSCATVQRVLKICRSQNARMTALLTSLTARSLARALQQRDQKYSKFVAVTAIDMRRSMSIVDECMANYISAVTETVCTSPSSDVSAEELVLEGWEAIRLSTQRLSEASSSLADQPIALLKYVSNLHAWTLKNAAKPPESSFGMSNLGVFTGSQDDSQGFNFNEDSWQIEDMVFSQSADGTGPPLNINVASAKDGPLAISITWWPGMLGVSDEGPFVEEVCASIKAQLESLS